MLKRSARSNGNGQTIKHTARELQTGPVTLFEVALRFERYFVRVEGLAMRAMRRIQGGRESASVYHRAKFMQLGLMAPGGVTLLVWPWPVAWGWLAGLAAGLLGLLAAVQWTYYKKHL